MATRAGGAIIGLFVLSVITFSLVRLLPGSVVDVMLGTENVTPEARAEFTAHYGLNRSEPVQYFRWISNVLHGNFGTTVKTGQPVSQVLLQKSIPSLQLAILAMLVAVAFSLLFGTLAALNLNRFVDKVISLVALVGMSIPEFVVGLFFVIVIARNVSFFPIVGYVPISNDFVGWLRHLILPAATLALTLSGYLTRITRASVSQVLQEDYVRTAAGKGLKRGTVMRRYIVRPSLIPVATTAGVLFVEVIGGIVIIEQIFAIPGIGQLIVSAIAQRDYALIQGTTLLIGSLAIIISLVIDLTYRLLDPRLRK